MEDTLRGGDRERQPASGTMHRRERGTTVIGLPWKQQNIDIATSFVGAFGREQDVRVESLIVRQCRDVPELEALYLVIGRQFGEEWDVSDRRLDAPRDRFDTDHELMLVLLDGSEIRGGVIAFGDDVVTVRALGIDDALRGHGHGRRLMELVEACALVRGAQSLVLGAADEARGFYEGLGYRGGRTMRQKQLPPAGALRCRLVARAAGALDQLPSEFLVT